MDLVSQTQSEFITTKINRFLVHGKNIFGQGPMTKFSKKKNRKVTVHHGDNQAPTGKM